MATQIKFAFFGSPKFAAVVLETLLAHGYIPSVVICNPDRPVGRKKIVTPPPVKLLLLNSQITARVKILQPERIHPAHMEFWSLKGMDFFLVAAFSKIISPTVFSAPYLGTIGIHPSLLPRHRGPTPIQTAILEGDKETGTSLFLIDEKVDHGPIITQRKEEIKNRKYEELEKSLAKLSGNLLVETIPNFIMGKIKPVPQEESQATFTKKFSIQDAFIDEKDLASAENGDELLALKIDRKIRALNPEPGTWMLQNGKRIKLLEARIENNKLELRKIQKEGRLPHRIS